ncbi:LacI family DNA-binding transcriptional regulator [Sinomonas sp. JGH33]|uniref:LacI family DNA-binding transcriptional regulator n=1 Tax=Sinomonas terricola TaxID=3110330 RepID=A0ABU5T5U0_9MICC|nr:LacI family DNA-binding transcriptional regulator [Sinomonas sp. JGH33]MEA5455040.1 LacI family DNA-binding transcriptional regulator [Sinomonas sp. JGH33]
MGSTPTVYDVAAAAGVSTATVSRFFRSPDKVKAATQESIRHAVDELGYIPSGLARGLAERHSGVVGFYSFSGHEPDELLMPEPGDPDTVRVVSDASTRPRLFPLFADEVLRGIELECTVQGLPLAVGWQKRDAGGVALDEIARRVDGLVVLPHVMSEPMLARLARTKPIVVVSQEPPAGTDLCSVTVNNRGGMHALVTHMIQVHGVRDFWFAGPVDDYDRTQRHDGFESAIREAGLVPPNGLKLEATRGRYDARDELLKMLRAERVRLPEAVVCANDQTALGVIEAFSEAGIRVPEDVAVTGFDGIDAGRFIQPGLTTVRQPMDLLGRMAVRMLSERMDDPSASPAHTVLPVQLLLRHSCGCSG